VQAAETGSRRAHTTAERRHQLRIESAPMREFCAYNKNCLRPWLAAHIGGSASDLLDLPPLLTVLPSSGEPEADLGSAQSNQSAHGSPLVVGPGCRRRLSHA
jgi:hypothetical protein